MNTTETVQILGNNYPKEHIKYAYTGKKMRYKKYIKYLGIFFLLVWLIQVFLVYQFQQVATVISGIFTTPGYFILRCIRIIAVIQISLIVAFVIVLIPRINCLFLKIDGIKKDIILYKSIHKDEVALIANEINTKIKESIFSSFPY